MSSRPSERRSLSPMSFRPSERSERAEESVENAVSAYRTSHRSLDSLRSLGMTGTGDASLRMTAGCYSFA